jgi:hypothetical protein
MKEEIMLRSELLHWEFIDQCIIGGILFIIISAMIIWYVRLKMKWETTAGEFEGRKILIITTVCFCTLFLLDTIYTAIKIKLSPDVYLAGKLQ